MSRIDIKGKWGRHSQLGFLNDNVWKCIGWINLVVNYPKKGCMILVRTHTNDPGRAAGQIERDFCGNT